ncbi:6037_t:CDS:2 [Entrophospora sp. SA101]|nr:6037_t:CDS:2 [Entrophospora sp. SA101]
MPNLSKWAKEWTKDKYFQTKMKGQMPLGSDLRYFFDNKMDIRNKRWKYLSENRVLLANLEVKPEPGMNNSCYTQNDVY